MSIGDGRSTYTDSTLMRLTKAELIDIIRCLEKNCKNYTTELDRAYEWRPVELMVFHHKRFKEIYNKIRNMRGCINDNERGYRHTELMNCLENINKSVKKLEKDTEVE